MAGHLRLECPGAVCHFTARGNARQPVVADDTDRERHVNALARVVSPQNWHCYAWAGPVTRRAPLIGINENRPSHDGYSWCDVAVIARRLPQAVELGLDCPRGLRVRAGPAVGAICDLTLRTQGFLASAWLLVDTAYLKAILYSRS